VKKFSDSPGGRLIKNIFFSPTSDGLLQLFRTAVIGVITFCADAGLLYLITESGVHYLVSAALSFVVSFFLNFSLVKKFVFQKCGKPFVQELLGYAGIAVVCLMLTEICMYVLTDTLGIYYILSKFVSAVLVLLWSFSARKFWLYRQ
jgi:putative flippase GtrA